MIGGEGTTYGKYFLIKRLAMGGMGEIFLAKLRGPVGFKKLLVIKRILPHHSVNDQFVNMFFAEARIAAQLSHPHIVQIYEMGEIERSYYLAMEYVAGKPLREIIDRARKLGESVPPAHTATMIADLCSGLSFAHNATGLSGTELSIIHRDVNPANLLISYSGDLKLIDFGIAKSGTSERTETGTIKGKFVYMSPEQSAAQPLDKRSDIFSVGICLYETLTGSNPFVKSNAVLSMDAIQRLEPPPVSQHSRKLAPFDPILAKALAKKRDDRYSDCNELADDLHALLRRGELDTPPTSLAAYMADIFEEQITSERRIIAAALENTQTEFMLEQGNKKNGAAQRSRQTRQLTPDEAADVSAASRVSSLDPMDTNGSTIARERRSSGRTVAEEAGLFAVHSRIPFFAALVLIVVLTVAGSVWITRATIAHRHAVAVEEARRILGQPRAGDVDINDPAVRRLLRRTKDADPMHAGIDELVIKSGRAPQVGSPSHDKGEKSDKGEKGKEEPKSTPQPVADTRGKTSGLGNVQVATEPKLSLTRGGRGTSVRIADNGGGDFVIGSGKDAGSDPFALTVRYAVLDDVMSFTLEPDPWAIVTCNNATSGRSPQTVRTVENVVTCDLTNPKEGRKLHVTLRRAR